MMSNANFPVNDLLRRRLQTGLTTATLTLSVASTLFLLLFSNRLGLGIASATGVLTQGLTAIFGQFILFIGILVFAVGAVLTSFIVFLMMAQRTRDFGLIKAAGCPNSLVAGYFMTELLTITFAGCILGVAFGFVADYAAANVAFSVYHLPNFWFAPLVFVAFFVLSLVFGLQPILKASRMSPIKALSPVNYYGLTVESKHKPLSRRGITWRIASRSLARRQSATVRIVILLSIVFMLLTVSVAGGIIAGDTTTAWVQKAVGKDTIAIAHSSMGNQYELLLATFTGAKQTGDFNYSDPNLAIADSVIAQLAALPSVDTVDSRLVVKEHAQEVANFTVVAGSLQTLPVGDSREADVVVIGVNPQNVLGEWSIKGRFLSGNGDFEAVIGDSISQTMYSPNANKYVVLADPLVEGMRIQNETFHITGVCVDPTNNGLVTFVTLDKLENLTGIFNPNLLLLKLNSSIDRNAALSEVRQVVQASDSDLTVMDLSNVVEKNVAFLSSTWQTIMLVPLLCLASATLSLVGYMMLAVDEQRQEFAVLRAVGAKPNIILNISAIQTLIVLASSFAIGLSLGVITTLIILMAHPLVTSFTLVEISVWLALALAAMFLLSLYPAFKLTKTSILKIFS
jgi:ABC-type antimicrobial peptide transport system permease subunit